MATKIFGGFSSTHLWVLWYKQIKKGKTEKKSITRFQRHLHKPSYMISSLTYRRIHRKSALAHYWDHTPLLYICPQLAPSSSCPILQSKSCWWMGSTFLTRSEAQSQTEREPQRWPIPIKMLQLNGRITRNSSWAVTPIHAQKFKLNANPIHSSQYVPPFFIAIYKVVVEKTAVEKMNNAQRTEMEIEAKEK